MSVSQAPSPTYAQPFVNRQGSIMKPWQNLINFLVAGSITRNILTLDSDVTVNDPGGAVLLGSEVEYQFTQDATGGHAVTWNAVFKGSPTVGATANTVTINRFRKIGVSQYMLLWESVGVAV